MTAIVPNYSLRLASANGEGEGGGESSALAARHDIVIDDYGKARQIAIDTNRRLLLNFTGVT